MRSRLVLAFLLMLAISVSAQDHQHGDHHSADDLGEVNFPVSCKPDVQDDFNRGIALLHDFWYAEAEKTFRGIAETDPDCAMAFWGVAMSNYHPLWAPPNPAELEKGGLAAQKAAGMAAKNEREKGYVAAIAAFYKDADRIDHKTRARAYADAMAGVHQQNPEDSEAAIFYSLALLGTADITDKTFAVQKKAAAILNPLVEKMPNHPGIVHYIIHSFDYPPLAKLALPAARTYAKIAPSSPHALHMPSHIFTRLGLWDESIQSNIASAQKAKDHVRKTMPDAGSFDQLHAMDYLVYAYLQLGQDDKAMKIAEEASQIRKLDLNNFAAAYALAAIPARIAIERHQWKDAANLQVKPEWFPWDKFPYTEAIFHYAIGLGASRTGDLEKARKAAARLAELQKVLEGKDAYWSEQVEIQAKTVEAWITYAEGKTDEALAMMKAVAVQEDSTEKHAVTPGAIMPARELYADMLLEMKQDDAARAEFEKALQVAPNRRHQSLHNQIATTSTSE